MLTAIISRIEDLKEVPREGLRVTKDGDPICYYCGGVLNKFSTHMDHVWPRDRGGSNSPNNLVRCCQECNLSKGSSHPLEWWRGLDLPSSLQVDILARIFLETLDKYEPNEDIMEKSIGLVIYPGDYLGELVPQRVALSVPVGKTRPTTIGCSECHNANLDVRAKPGHFRVIFECPSCGHKDEWFGHPEQAPREYRHRKITIYDVD